ncbi:MAG: hypothetical protein ACKOPT_05100 [Cyanobium sp.]|nr:hypothetical protein [Cyanobacteriota bacterium]
MTARPDATAQAPSAPQFEVSREPTALEEELKPLLSKITEMATSRGGDPQALLVLLRHLEQLHRSIQDGPFRSSLPSERSSLFKLLQDMELKGGWPYIPRLQLRTFLDLLQEKELHPQQLDSDPDLAEAA